MYFFAMTKIVSQDAYAVEFFIYLKIENKEKTS